ncbi:MAG: hypothetical protein ABIJ97_17160 [Bacteroidota bacterium]
MKHKLISILFAAIILSEIIVIMCATQENERIQGLLGSARAQSELSLIPYFIFGFILNVISIVGFLVYIGASLFDKKIKVYYLPLTLALIASIIPVFYYYIYFH